MWFLCFEALGWREIRGCHGRVSESMTIIGSAMEKARSSWRVSTLLSHGVPYIR